MRAKRDNIRIGSAQKCYKHKERFSEREMNGKYIKIIEKIAFERFTNKLQSFGQMCKLTMRSMVEFEKEQENRENL